MLLYIDLRFIVGVGRMVIALLWLLAMVSYG
jgi:hypothetical protein